MLLLAILLKAKLIALLIGCAFAVGWYFYQKNKSSEMAKPLHDYEADFIKNLRTATGKDFREWMAIIESSGLTEKKAIREWLQKEQNLDYMPAHKLSHLFVENEELHGPKVWFSGSGRGGDMGYESKEGSFKMYWEMGGGDVLAIIYVPNEKQWETKTNIPIEKRLKVLHFIGKKTVERQTAGGKGTYEIQENNLIIKS